MDDDIRRRILQTNPTTQSAAGYQGQPWRWRVNASTGEPEAYLVLGRGVDVFEEFPNSTPEPQAPNTDALSNFGTPRSPIFAPLVPVQDSGNSANSLTLDPNPQPKLGSDTKGARGQGPAVFPG